MLVNFVLLQYGMWSGVFLGACFSLILGWGRVGGLIGFVIGLTLSGPLLHYLLIRPVMYFYPLPRCCKGKCIGYGDYATREGSYNGGEGWNSYCYRCDCGDVYVRQGRRFQVVADDGSLRPYKRLVAFRQWVMDADREIANRR